MDHQWHKCNDETCLVCNGGLQHCNICHCAEGSLPSDCPGEPVDTELQDRIMNNKLNYVNGAWEVLK